jgi:hypothetical protein
MLSGNCISRTLSGNCISARNIAEFVILLLYDFASHNLDKDEIAKKNIFLQKVLPFEFWRINHYNK